MLSFTLLGPVALSKNGLPLARFRSQKEAALLIYLAQTGQAHQREFIAEFLWNGRSTKQALSNLRTALTRLRKQAGDSLVITRTSLSLAPGSRQQVDSVNLLRTLAEVGRVDSAEQAAALQATLAGYRGDFLADFTLPDAPNFDEWVITTREQIRREVIAAYEKLGRYALSTIELGGDVEYGIAVARRWLGVDALDESAHMLLLQLLLRDGQVRAAVAHYEGCVELLRTELDVAPPAEMTALIRSARPAPALAQPPVFKQPPAAVCHNLPAPHDQFFGRVSTQQEIHTRLDQPWCRLITLVGQGGVGKTRLAATVARSRLDRYRDGAWLIELAELDGEDDDLAEAIAVEIATALDLRLSGTDTPLEQLLTYLQHRQTLLVLDNFEHLIEAGVQLVLTLLQRCEGVQLLVTSREALRVRAEWTVALTGLCYPADDTEDDINGSRSDAVDLFAARCEQERLGVLGADDLAAMSQICRMVEGLPLAIELAAALTCDIAPRAVADKLRGGFDSLTTSLRDVPQRHRSLQMVFETSWRTLTTALQQRLAHLSVFRGGFTAKAAQQIAEADTEQLAALRAKSLLSYDAALARYWLHPVVRKYAAKQALHGDQTRQRHARYYLALLARHTDPLQKDAPQHAMVAIEPDIDNVRAAWQAGLAGHNADLLSAALTSLSIYYQLRGLAREAEAVMHTTLRTAMSCGADGSALATRAGLERARFQNRLGRYRPAVQTINTALKLAVRCADRWAEGMGHVLWGEALWRLGEYDVAAEKLRHALAIANEIDATELVGWCHHHLGVINDIQGRYERAHDHLQQAGATWRAIENAQALSGSLNSIGLVCYHQGNLPAAQQAMEEALTLCNQLYDGHRQSTLLNNLSIISTEQGDYLNAHHYLLLGLELAIHSGNLTSQGEIYNNLGRNYLQMGNAGSAVKSLEQGLQVAESIRNRPLTATIMFNLADAEEKQVGSERAKSWYSQALEIARQDNMRRTECEVLIGMAEILSKTNELQARQHSSEAVALAEAIQNPDLLERANALNHYLSVSAGV